MIEIPRAIINELIGHARIGFPLEVCGILGGSDGAVSRLYRMTNTDASREHFTMEPKEQFEVARDLRARSLTMLAIYHSHPQAPACPSEEDIRLAVAPDVSYVIVSLTEPDNPEVRSFRIAGGKVEQEELAIT
ncbi:M67 family metallopeptidase [Geomonas sp. Red32]|uniref:Mov34/MPN/PAD-1 family protein n=1 Tax=Geomonas sp. Red32 TaxID=2912856 RepID=UPI00202CC5C2|nr:M67 family metallopeptidase [Geomonas sp. Red32]MCM0081446.1 M67 family metallopeptidase [Geomonas sp. Red32]